MMTVDGAYIDLSVNPGETHSKSVVVSVPPDGVGMDIKFVLGGLGYSPQGIYEWLPPEKDISPCSAADFVTEIDNSHFSLQPGHSQAVGITISVPLNLNFSNSYYSMIRILGVPSETRNVVFATDINVPIMLSVNGVEKQTTGSIIDSSVDEMEPGMPLRISTVFQNTGNHHYRPVNEIVVADDSDAIIARSITQLNGADICPTYNYRFNSTLDIATDEIQLSPGTYSLESRIVDDYGAILDSNEILIYLGNAIEEIPPTDRFIANPTPVLKDQSLNNSQIGTVSGDTDSSSRGFPIWAILAIVCSLFIISLLLFRFYKQRYAGNYMPSAIIVSKPQDI